MEACTSMRRLALRKIMDFEESVLSRLHVCGFWDLQCEYLSSEAGYCRGCTKEDENLINAAMAEVWNGLPKLFGLPGPDS